MTSEAPPATLKAIQARGYRSLRHVDLRFDGNFNVLVGPNGSGKSTLLDAVAFLSDYIQQGLERAVGRRTRNFQDLVWGRPTKSPGFELAFEFEVGDQELRYELSVEESGDGMRVVAENGYLRRLTPGEFAKSAAANSICKGVLAPGRRQRQIFGQKTDKNIVWFRPGKNDRREIHFPRRLDDDWSAIGQLLVLRAFFPFRYKDEMDFSDVETIADAVARRSVQCIQLDSRKLRQASRPNGDDGRRLADDGSNLPRVLEELQSDPEEWGQWLDFVRLALPEIEDVRIVHREDDRHAYMMVRRAGIEVPSWGVSEGTLRLFALTVIAHLRKFPLAYLLEEPENGIHPMAIEYVYQSLSTVSGAQVFIASHSPTLLRCVGIGQVLCFGHDPQKGTVIVPGNEHPRLKDWQHSVDDTVFWAADILS
ncbi:MAG: ATP-binding protein [Rhodobacteraceae bacterium]|nr:ATP-binding protein [Paracoccaceae bacterium]MCY4137830.1 ATP-binding protein [Paracoccaceae bacterium]